MKPCTQCGEIKDADDFYKERRSRDGLRSECRSCVSTYQKARYEQNRDATIARTAQWRSDNPSARTLSDRRARAADPDKYRDQELRRKYGITLEQYNQMLDDQGGLCALCEKPPVVGKHKVLCVDHCHDTNRVRKLLCSECNIGLGKFKDDPALLIAAAEYVQRHTLAWVAA